MKIFNSYNGASRILRCFALFMYLYEFVFLGFPSILSSRKIAFFLCFIYLIFIKKEMIINKQFIKYVSIILFLSFSLIIYTMSIKVIIGWGTGSSILSRLIYFALYSLLGVYVVGALFNDLRQFMTSLLDVGILQAVIVFSQLLSRAFREFLTLIFLPNGNVEFTRIERATGLGSEAAALSLLLLCSLFACSYFLIVEGKSNIYYVFSYIFILIAAMMVARTGFYIGTLLLFYIILITIFQKKIFISFKIILYCLGFGCLVIFILMNLYPERLSWILRWSSGLFTSKLGDNSIVVFSEMQIPHISPDTFLGTGIYRGAAASGIEVQHDSGYIQSYFSLGFIFSSILYLVCWGISLKCIQLVRLKSLRYLLYVYWMIMMTVEIKEPFLFKYMLLFIFLEIVYLYVNRNDAYREKLKIRCIRKTINKKNESSK